MKKKSLFVLVLVTLSTGMFLTSCEREDELCECALYWQDPINRNEFTISSYADYSTADVGVNNCEEVAEWVVEASIYPIAECWSAEVNP